MAAKLIALVETVKVAVAACCITFMVRAVTPVPLTVMIATRAVVLVLAATVTDIVPLFEPEVGEMVSHSGALLLTVQFVLEVIVNVCCCPVAAKTIPLVDKVRFGADDAPDCVTVMVLAVTSVPVTVMVAVRAVVLVWQQQ